MHTHKMTKVISISDEAYEELRRVKNGMSFSEAILELSNDLRRENLAKFSGVITREEADAIKKEIAEERRKKSRRMP